MKNLRLIFILLCTSFVFNFGNTQDTDSLCVNIDDQLYIDLSIYMTAPGPVELLDQSGCFRIDEEYFLTWKDPINHDHCCGEHNVRWFDLNGGQMYSIVLTIKCIKEKPECFLVNLEDYLPDPAGQGPPVCLNACEYSQATYFVPYSMGSTYMWIVNGDLSHTTNTNGNEIYIEWGTKGYGSVQLFINGVLYGDFCVDILDSPEASFTKSASIICLNGEITFTNTTIGGTSFLWDFGDSNTSVNPNPTHQFTSPGFYDVILYATNSNQDSMGNPLCCCSDTMVMQVEVEDLEGPNIYWISTLCEGDESKYWTDADCTNNNWVVKDFNGVIIPYVGDGNDNDTICVQWGTGPSGTISLDVSGCATAYCSRPTIATVPIISSVSVITGLDVVCAYSSSTYTLPKWPSVYYDWTVTGGTFPVEQNGMNSITIDWGGGPVGTIHVDYYSEFLAGTFGQTSDCAGKADLLVDIRPEFSLTGPVPSLACVGTSTNIFATSFPSASYTWTVTPFAPFTDFGSYVQVDWLTGPGTYTITAVSNDPTAYCNAQQSFTMTVIGVPNIDSITGPMDICPTETYTYFGHTSTPNTELIWTVSGGTPLTGTGSPIVVTWNATGPYTLSLTQKMLNQPFCESGPVTKIINEKVIQLPIAFTSVPACINSTATYNVPTIQHDDAMHEWSISPLNAGSVGNGQGTNTADVQWNNTPQMVTLTYTVTLCGKVESYASTFMLNAPDVPVITQMGYLCPGATATLEATPGFVSYNWTGPTFGTGQILTINSGGTYVLTTTDGNGCSAIVTFEAVETPLPVAKISTGDPKVLCLNATGQTVNLVAQTNPDYEFTWYEGAGIVQGPSPMATYQHMGNNTAGFYYYTVEVRNTITGCINTSDVIVVEHRLNCGGTPVCNPGTYNIMANAVITTPNCNEPTFPVTHTSNVTITHWEFDDGINNINSGSLINAKHIYDEAGCYNVRVYGTVPNLNNPANPAYCVVLDDVSVCVPLAAQFEYDVDCDTVCFNDLSTYLPGHMITNWSWDFGDSNGSTAPSPCHIYAGAGMYTVILTIEDATGCQISVSHTVTILGPPTGGFGINPNPACVGDQVDFTGTGAGIIDWFWNFGDTTTNGAQSPFHTYLNAGNYDVSLTVTDVNGCMNTIVQPITIYPNPADDVITFSSPLTFCDGDNVILNAPPGPYTYMWSNGSASPFITVTTAGDFDVTVTDGNGCKMVTPPVTIVVIPLPDAEITGNLYVCDNGCTTLTASTGAGYVYQWFLNGAPIPGEINSDIIICGTTYSLPSDFHVEVTDQNGCVSVSFLVHVQPAISPIFSIALMGDACEGSANILTVPFIPDVKYSWSTGETGLSIAVIQAGLVTVIGTDTITGCSSTDQIVIHPLPDLCIVPTGCYKVCDPDTICGPPGLAAYQWNMNGIPITDGTGYGPCLIVSVSGSYSLTATTDNGCDMTSDTLILNVMECEDCTDQIVTSKPIVGNSGCCYSLSYQNNFTDLFGLMMHTADAEIVPDLSSLDPSLLIYTSGTNFVGITGNPAAGHLPSGNVFDYLEFCLTNITTSPQYVYFDWYNDSLDIVCHDTLIFDCPVDSNDCVYISEDFIYCQNEQVVYTMDVCNPSSNTFDFEYFAITPTSPAGLIASPTVFDYSTSPVTPGNCVTLTILLNGSNIANKDFCFNLTAHETNPNNDPGALCCSLDTVHCIPIPGCTPCDNAYIESVTTGSDSCCYDVQIVNNYDPMRFDQIVICPVSPNTTMTINNPFNSNWNTTVNTATNVGLSYKHNGGLLPLGAFTLPEICVESEVGPEQFFVIKWMDGADVVCVDTFATACEPDCGYMIDDKIECLDKNGFWYWTGYIKNTSNVVMNEANIQFDDPNLAAYNTTVTLGSLAPGASFGPFSILIGPPAIQGQEYCMTVTLHQLGHNAGHEECCDFTHCITLPYCNFDPGCVCDEHFEKEVEKGLSCVQASNLWYSFQPLGALKSCDRVFWEWPDGSTNQTVGTQGLSYQFPSYGEFKVCITVYRIADNGKRCKARFCKEVQIHENSVDVFPNPNRGSFTLKLYEEVENSVNIKMLNTNNKVVGAWQEKIDVGQSEVDLHTENLPNGMYFLMVEIDGELQVEKVIVNH